MPPLRKKRASKSSAGVQTPASSAPRWSDTQIAEMDALLEGQRGRSKRPIAIFLGAGASRSFGYPLTRDLMLKIFDGLMNRKILDKDDKGGQDPRDELLKFLTDLLPGERYSEQKVPMVTGVLSLLDFSLATNQALLPSRSLNQTRRARQLLERAVLEVIPDHEWFSTEEEQLFDRFTEWLGHLKSHRPRGGLGLITSNYDMLSDLAVMYAADVHGDVGNWELDEVARKVDFGFRWVHPDGKNEEVFARPKEPEISLFKLHGSTNWLRCPLCDNLYITPDGPIGWLAGQKKREWDDECHCSPTRLEAQIVSPSFVREMREPNLIATWKSALEFLREAEHWILIGYSFPDEDVGIRALFTRAFGSNNHRPKVTVIQLTDDARVNYESFFPDGSVKYLTGGLELLLDRWKTLQSKSKK